MTRVKKKNWLHFSIDRLVFDIKEQQTLTINLHTRMHERKKKQNVRQFECALSAWHVQDTIMPFSMYATQNARVKKIREFIDAAEMDEINWKATCMCDMFS